VPGQGHQPDAAGEHDPEDRRRNQETEAARFPDTGEHITQTERRAAAAERDAVDRYLAAFMSQRIGEVFDARISGVTRFGLFVTLEANGASGIVPLASLPDDRWIEDHFRTPRSWNSFPLFHFALLKLGGGHFVFVQKFHHVLSDAIGRFQCFQRIACLYDALVQDIEPPPAEAFALTDRLAEEAAYLNSSAYQADLAYWNSRLENLPALLVEVDRSKSERGKSGRPSRLSGHVEATGGVPSACRVAGRVQPIAQGTIAVPPA